MLYVTVMFCTHLTVDCFVKNEGTIGSALLTVTKRSVSFKTPDFKANYWILICQHSHLSNGMNYQHTLIIYFCTGMKIYAID